MRAIDADALMRCLTTIERLARSDAQQALLGRVYYIVSKQPTIQSDEPRVMTLEEVIEHYSLPPVFVDDFGAQEDYYEDIQPLYFEFPHDHEDAWIVHWRGHAQVARYLDGWKHTYNKKWRCWTARPTDKQRKGVKWDD